MRQDVEIKQDTAHLSTLLQFSLRRADPDVESPTGGSMTKFARNINTMRLWITTEVDPNYSIKRSISHWVCFLRHSSQYLINSKAQQKQTALGII